MARSWQKRLSTSSEFMMFGLIDTSSGSARKPSMKYRMSKHVSLVIKFNLLVVYFLQKSHLSSKKHRRPQVAEGAHLEAKFLAKVTEKW